MKFKKLFLSLGLATALLAGGCAKQEKQSQPVLNKTQVIKKAQKSFKSGEATQTVILGTDTDKQKVSTKATFGGNPTVFHINYQTTSNGKTQTSEEWADHSNHLYINGQSSWYKAKLDQVTGHTYADLLDSIMHNEMLIDPPAKLTDAYKMKRKGNTYTLTANLKDKKIMQQAVDPVFITDTQSPKQQKVYRQLEKAGKFQSMTVKLVVKNQKMTSFSYHVNLKVGKLMKFTVSQSYNNMGSQDFLKIPTNALNGKPLPKAKPKKK
ncbi:hypothetical protein OZX56_00910 [Lactobacillus sp. ESL0684]|uniref:DUF6612 family protein n=1 Tax=Lactobacillus sp. ESL0684 TaxID=2983213 RepID=UPI0023F9E172|nr:DUF6612 family protein [Lactobacillus sp. ESL0684]WEV43830.1 hypothetical protein OZX56_00910 [Lactobacillus sp. ESL0684]